MSTPEVYALGIVGVLGLLVEAVLIIEAIWKRGSIDKDRPRV